MICIVGRISIRKWGWWSHWMHRVCNSCVLPKRSLRRKTHRTDPLSTRLRCLVTRFVTKRRLEMVGKILANVNDCWWRFAAGVSLVSSFMFSVSESSVVAAYAMGLRRFVRGAATVVPVVRTSACIETPAVRPLGVRDLWCIPVDRLWCHAENKRRWRLLSVPWPGKFCQRCLRRSLICPEPYQRVWLGLAMEDGWPSWCEKTVRNVGSRLLRCLRNYCCVWSRIFSCHRSGLTRCSCDKWHISVLSRS